MLPKTNLNLNLALNYFTVIVIVINISVCNAFNLSPNPNIVLREPQLKTTMPKMRSSYFGFTINLKHNR